MDRRELKQAARRAILENSFVMPCIPMTRMIILEGATHQEDIFGVILTIVDYVMFEDKKTGKQYQCYYGEKHYNPERQTLWAVEEYRRKENK